MMHDLSKGIPFDSNSVDAVYHSHMLPHLDRDVAEDLLREVVRVLKPGGIQRIVVPDLETRCQDYLAHLATCDTDAAEHRAHDDYVATLFELSVRKEAYGTASQKPVRRFVENLVLGDARARGETLQWMYDRINLRVKLLDAGFSRVEVHDYTTSLIENWAAYGLDTDEHGNQSKRGSLYIEGVK
jgi:ubiquinone/menaquinone biosynthesis C-methylase UbiE